MIARAFLPADLEAVTKLCPDRPVDPSVDAIMVLEEAGQVRAMIAFRPVAYVYPFALEDGALKRVMAEVLLAYALGAGRALGQRTAIFTVESDNVAMRQFIESKGAKEQPGVVYSMEIR
jgi:hypothetical protein